MPSDTSLSICCRGYLQQPAVDLLLTNTASSEAGSLLAAFGFKKVPAPQYSEPFFWITEPVGFAASCLRKEGLPAWSLLKYLAGTVIGLLSRVREPASAKEATPEVQSLDCVDARFDDFWENMAQCPGRLYACRDRSWLEWHCGARLQQQKVWILALPQGQQLLGYAIVQRQDSDKIGLERAQVVSIQGPGRRLFVGIGSAYRCIAALPAGGSSCAGGGRFHALETQGLRDLAPLATQMAGLAGVL